MVSKPRTLRKSLVAFGLALVASLALSVALAPASALAAVPKNTALPVVSPTQPVVNGLESATTGTWTESPTSYSYEWLRCATSETITCKFITGANASTYVPVEADRGQLLYVQVTAKNSSGSATASSKKTLATIAEHWYGGGAKLAEGVATGFTMKKWESGSNFKMKWSFATIENEVSCTSQSIVSKGGGAITALNPSGGGAGALALGTENAGTFVLSGCTVTKPSHCTIPGGMVRIPVSGGQTGEASGKPAVTFNPLSSEQIFELSYGGGSECFYNGQTMPFGVEGLTGIALSKPSSSLEFNGRFANFSGKPVTLEGVSTIETTTGKTLTIAP